MEIEKGKANSSVANADDAKVPEHLWDQALSPEGGPWKHKSLPQLRSFVARWWKSHIRREFLSWLFQQYPTLRDALHRSTPGCPSWAQMKQLSRKARVDWNAGWECIPKCCDLTWWEWNGGLRP